MATKPTVLCLEVAPRRVFASALDWPGWARSGRTEETAIESLAAYLPRYAVVARRAGLAFSAKLADSFDIVERLTGGAGTEFGVPEAVAQAETRPVTRAAATRLGAVLAAAWEVFDEVAATTPAQLRKGPRGGGRDRDAMIAHVLEAEAAYARKLGIRCEPPALDDIAAIETQREEIAAVIASPSDGAPVVPRGWPTRYAARRVVWHLLDHAWELQDRS